MKVGRNVLAITFSTLLGILAVSMLPADQPHLGDDERATQRTPTPVARVAAKAPAANSQPASLDWPQWGGTSERNNVPVGQNIPIEWDIGGFDRQTGAWRKEDAVNILWTSQVGSQTYGNPVVADGRVYVGTNNGAGYLQRYPQSVDLGCMLAFRESDGKFLWQHSSEKLPTGRVHDWPLQGICCAPLVEGKRLWYVSSRGEVVCLDTEGYYDDEDDGPVKGEWARIMTDAPALATGLETGRVPEALLLALRDCGIPAEARLNVTEQGAGWQIKVSQRNAEPRVLNVVSSDEKLIVREAGADEDLLKLDALLTNGLNEGQLCDALRSLIQRGGVELPSSLQIETEAPGSRWKLSSKLDPTLKMTIRRMGPNLAAFKQTTIADKHEADTVWVYDMMKELGVSQHNMCSCSVTSWGDILFVNTSNGVDESHKKIPAPYAPSFFAMDKHTGKVFWTDNSPGTNILHGQWSSPAVGELGGVPQVIFAGGDGWVYSFRADQGQDGNPTLLWKFDANPKDSQWILGGAGTRNNIIATPVIHGGNVYVAVGQDPEHGEGVGHLWCIDPTKRGDVSPELAMKIEQGRRVPIPHRREIAVNAEEGEVAVDNPNSAAIWHYSVFDQNEDGEIDFEETMHRSCGTVAIKNNILYIADFSGLFHCLDATTGKVHWTYDMLAAAWGSPLIVEDKVYIGDEDGDLTVFNLSAEPHDPIAEISMANSVYSTPIVANNVLFISNKTHLFAIKETAD